MTVVVTGAQGFIGRYVCSALLRCGESVVGIGRSARDDAHTTHTLFDGKVIAPVLDELRPSASDRYEYRSTDIRDKSSFVGLLSETRPRAVIHLATPLRDEPWAVLSDIAIGGTLTLVEAINDSGLRCKLVVGSSASVYGCSAALPVSEDAPCVPADFYGIAKYAAERIALAAASPQLSVVAARLFNILGPGEDERHAPARFACQAVDPRAQFIAVGDLSTTRDFLDVRDAATALLRLCADDVATGAYNVCSGVETPMQDILDGILRAANRELPVVTRYARAIDMPRQFGDAHKLASLGVRPRYTLTESLETLVTYYRSALPPQEPRSLLRAGQPNAAGPTDATKAPL